MSTYPSLPFDEQPLPPRAERCETCGAKRVEYRHKLNTGLVKGLIALYRKGESKLDDLGLTFSQANNFQKLRYWNLVEKGKSGIWKITGRGIDFVEGRLKVQRIVRTYRGERQGFEGEFISLSDVSEFIYRKREDYLGDAQPILERQEPSD